MARFITDQWLTDLQATIATLQNVEHQLLALRNADHPEEYEVTAVTDLLGNDQGLRQWAEHQTHTVGELEQELLTPELPDGSDSPMDYQAPPRSSSWY